MPQQRGHLLKAHGISTTRRKLIGGSQKWKGGCLEKQGLIWQIWDQISHGPISGWQNSGSSWSFQAILTHQLEAESLMRETVLGPLTRVLSMQHLRLLKFYSWNLRFALSWGKIRLSAGQMCGWLTCVAPGFWSDGGQAWVKDEPKPATRWHFPMRSGTEQELLGHMARASLPCIFPEIREKQPEKTRGPNTSVSDSREAPALPTRSPMSYKKIHWIFHLGEDSLVWKRGWLSRQYK